MVKYHIPLTIKFSPESRSHFVEKILNFRANIDSGLLKKGVVYNLFKV